MYHIFLDEEAVNKFAQRLASVKSFRDGTYTLYADVPVKCFGAYSPFFTSRDNLATMNDHTAAQTVDFVVAQGDTALLAICGEVMASKSKKLFQGPLLLLSNIIMRSDSNVKRKYNTLFRQVLEFLEEAAPIAPELYTLVPRELGLPEQELRRRYLLQHTGNISAYGRAHGIFFRLSIGPDGTLQRQAVTSEAALPDYRRSCDWASGLPENYDALRALLDTPMDVLLKDDTVPLQRLLQIERELNAITPLIVDISTVGDIPQQVYRLRCTVNDMNDESEQIMELTGELLDLLGSRLAQDSAKEEFKILRLPLSSFYQQAALYCGTHYPLWLFDYAVRPFMNERQYPGELTMHGLLTLRMDLPEKVPFPTLSDTLLAPLCRPA